MRSFCDLIYLLLLWMVLDTQAQSSSFYRRNYFSPIASSPSTFYHHNSGFVPLTYHEDLLPEESKRKDSPKTKYTKKIPFRFGSEEDEDDRFNSAEYSNESHGYNSKDNDSHEYTIGTKIRVQHPITVPKKATSSHPKHTKYSTHSHSPYHSSSSSSSTSYSDLNISTEDRVPESSPKKHTHSAHKYTQLYEPDPFHVVQPPKTTAPSAVGYNVYEPESEEYESAGPSSNRAKTTTRDRFKGVASKKQIEKYLEDQQKILSEALKIQLLNDPKFEKYLKSNEKERPVESDEYEHDAHLSPPQSYRPNFDDSFKPTRSRRRPQAAELRRPPKAKHTVATKPKRRFRSAIVISA